MSSGYECGARQPVQQQTEETTETTEICRMSGQKGKSLLPHIVLNEFILCCVIGVIWTVVPSGPNVFGQHQSSIFFHYTTI